MGALEGVNLDINRLSIDTSSEVIDSELVGSREIRQLGINGVSNGASGVEIKNSQSEAICLGPRVDEEAFEDFG